MNNGVTPMGTTKQALDTPAVSVAFVRVGDRPSSHPIYTAADCAIFGAQFQRRSSR
jgi:hypothetical protein